MWSGDTWNVACGCFPPDQTDLAVQSEPSFSNDTQRAFRAHQEVGQVVAGTGLPRPSLGQPMMADIIPAPYRLYSSTLGPAVWTMSPLGSTTSRLMTFSRIVP